MKHLILLEILTTVTIFAIGFCFAIGFNLLCQI